MLLNTNARPSTGLSRALMIGPVYKRSYTDTSALRLSQRARLTTVNLLADLTTH